MKTLMWHTVSWTLSMKLHYTNMFIYLSCFQSTLNELTQTNARITRKTSNKFALLNLCRQIFIPRPTYSMCMVVMPLHYTFNCEFCCCYWNEWIWIWIRIVNALHSMFTRTLYYSLFRVKDIIKFITVALLWEALSHSILSSFRIIQTK